MPVLQNDLVRVELDPRWPRTLAFARLDTGGALAGCDPARPFALELNGDRVGEDALTCEVSAGETVDYRVGVPSLGLALRFRFALDGQEVVFSLAEVTEEGDFRLDRLHIPDHYLVSGLAAGGDSFLRHVTRRRNWSEDWCPGTGTYEHWEDLGAVGGAQPERGPQYTNHACVWNERICAALSCSIWVQPLLSSIDAEGSVKPGRAGRIGVWAGTHWYRLRGELAQPLVVRIGILADYNGNGAIDWCDAANWEADTLPAPDPMYREVLVYKIHLDQPRLDYPMRSFADALEMIKLVHQVSGGIKQIAYVTGWQFKGHDTGYPSIAVVNERAGGLDAFLKLIEDAKAYNCVVSMHINYDSCYSIHPEWREDVVSRDGEGQPFVWYTKNPGDGRKVYSTNHTMDVETGFAEDRLTRLLAMLPLRESIHLDAFRPYSEAWEPNGDYIGSECEVQRGIIPIIRMFRERGLDITTEDTDAEKRGLFNWVWIQPNWHHRYETAMYHGRLLGYNRSTGFRVGGAVEADILGYCRFNADEVETWDATVEGFYLHWMYSQVLSRKRMVGYHEGDWHFGVRACYEDDTWVYGESHPHTLEANYAGIPIRRGASVFLPWREDTIFAYSKDGGAQEWTLPADWEGAPVSAAMLRRGGALSGLDVTIEGRTIRYAPPAGIPVRFTRG